LDSRERRGSQRNDSKKGRKDRKRKEERKREKEIEENHVALRGKKKKTNKRKQFSWN